MKKKLKRLARSMLVFDLKGDDETPVSIHLHKCPSAYADVHVEKCCHLHEELGDKRPKNQAHWQPKLVKPISLM